MMACARAACRRGLPLGLALGALLCSLFATVAVTGPLVLRYVAGEHYRVIPEPVAFAGAAIPVIEFFQYGCPHCYAFDPAVTRWQQTLPDEVAFRRVPVVFGPGGRFYARLFYTAKALGVLPRLHAKIFDAIHEHGRDLSDFAAARAFFEAHGIDGSRFARVFNSPAIDEKIARATQLARAFQVRAVPSLGVAGRWWISGRTAGSNDAMFDVAEFLLKKSPSVR